MLARWLRCWGCGVVGGVDVPLAGLFEPVGVGEHLVDGGPDSLFERVGGQLAGMVGAAFVGEPAGVGVGALVVAGGSVSAVDAGDGASAGAGQEAGERVEAVGALPDSGDGS